MSFSIVSRVFGSNHMTCKSCKGHWCWVCGQEIDGKNPGWHYSEKNANSGCKHFQEAQTQDMEAIMQARRIGLRQSKLVGAILDCFTFPVRLIIMAYWLVCIIGVLIHFVMAAPVYFALLLLKHPKRDVLWNMMLTFWMVIVLIPLCFLLIALSILWPFLVSFAFAPLAWLTLKLKMCFERNIETRKELCEVSYATLEYLLRRATPFEQFVIVFVRNGGDAGEAGATTPTASAGFGEWVCPACTLENISGSLVCNACGGARLV